MIYSVTKWNIYLKLYLKKESISFVVKCHKNDTSILILCVVNHARNRIIFLQSPIC